MPMYCLQVNKLCCRLSEWMVDCEDEGGFFPVKHFILVSRQNLETVISS